MRLVPLAFMGILVYNTNMSYARQNENSDLYIVRVSDKWYCHACPIYPVVYESVAVDSLAKLYAHLMLHIEFGHKVAQKTLTRVSLELENETTV